MFGPSRLCQSHPNAQLFRLVPVLSLTFVQALWGFTGVLMAKGSKKKLIRIKKNKIEGSKKTNKDQKKTNKDQK